MKKLIAALPFLFACNAGEAPKAKDVVEVVETFAVGADAVCEAVESNNVVVRFLCEIADVISNTSSDAQPGKVYREVFVPVSEAPIFAEQHKRR